MKKLLVLAFSLWSFIAIAQEIPNHAVPVGRGPGVIGYGFIGPCSVGQTFIFQGSAADPICGGTGTSLHNPVSLATTAPLPAYTFTSTGGGTLTATANAALSIDSVVVTAGTRVLIKDEPSAGTSCNGNSPSACEGIYTVNAVGSAGAPYVLQRSTALNSNGFAENTSSAWVGSDSVPVMAGGATNANSVWTNTAVITTLNQTPFSWFQASTGVSQPWQISGSNIYYTAGNVGIGIIPTMKLQIDSGSLFMSGPISGPAWTTNGVRLKQQPSQTVTDTTSSGTVASAYTNRLSAGSIAASSATTFTKYYGLWLDTPTAGTNVTLGHAISLGTQGDVEVGGNLAVIGSITGGTWTGPISIPASGFFSAPNATINKLNDRAFFGGATSNDGTCCTDTGTWLGALSGTMDGTANSIPAAQIAVLTDNTSVNHSNYAFLSGARSINASAAGTSIISIFSVAVNNNVTLATSAWGLYIEAWRFNNTVSQTNGIESEIRNLGSSITTDPFTLGGFGMSYSLGAGCGAGLVGGNACSLAIEVFSNPNPFNSGIQFATASILARSGIIHAIDMPAEYKIVWYAAANSTSGYIWIGASGTFNIVSNTSRLNLNGTDGVTCSPGSVNSNTLQILGGIAVHC